MTAKDEALRDRKAAFAFRCGGWFAVLFACGYDVLTPDEQNATAVLIGIAGLLLFAIAELRSLRAHMGTGG